MFGLIYIVEKFYFHTCKSFMKYGRLNVIIVRGMKDDCIEW